MKKITACIAAAVTGAALLVSGISTSLNVSADEDGTIETVTINTDDLEVNTTDPAEGGPEKLGASAENLIHSLLASDIPEGEGTLKEETVYIVADANGQPKKLIVSDWLKNAGKAGKLNDVSELNDIENIKGNESFTKNGGECVWDANGADISYRGTTQKELPVDVKVTYSLDGKVMTPEEIKGKSGHVTIRFDYDNKAYREVVIDGKKEQMTVPFMMLTGVILDDDRFTNISAANAKLINDGSRTVVIGFALPGIQDNLAIDRSKFEIPDSLVIEADVTDFSLSMTVTMATNELFGKLDKLDIKDLDNLSASMEELTNAMTALTDGSEALSDGLAQLLTKSGELETGVGQLADGAGKLKDGADQLKTGTDALSSGAGDLSNGITMVDAGMGTLSDGASQLKTGLDTLAGSNEALTGGADTIFTTLLATATSQIREGGADIPDLTKENYGKVLDGVLSQLDQAVALYEKADAQTAAVYKEKAKAITELKASLDGYNTFYTGLKAYTDGVAQAAAGAGELKNGADTLKAGTGALKDGADTLKNGAEALKGGIDALDEGAGKLDKGLKELKNNIPALKDGVTKLYDGSVQLSDGIKEFNEKGISKITEAVEGELEGVIERIRVMGEISKAYNNFSGISDSMNGRVKFIYRTDEIR